MPQTAAHPEHPTSSVTLTLGVLGIAFGDIGTKPLYAFEEFFNGLHGVAPTPNNVLGVLSLIFWALTLVVTVKYITFLTRADNHGEGGIMALLALVPERLRKQPPGRIGLINLLAIVGAALLFGSAIVMPAISVLSAVEGLEAVTPDLKPFIVPITCTILFLFFLSQRKGTGSVAKSFGPVMLLWLFTIGALGAYHLVRWPHVLAALSPHHAFVFLRYHGWHGVRILGSATLVVSGGEALYAAMGHFGRVPIQRAWLIAAYPTLILCYFGQGALLLQQPNSSYFLLYSMAIRAGIFTYALVAMVALATVTSIIASQALISGMFSLTHQAVRLGFFPRVLVVHTSDKAEGQIYVPIINWGLALACISLVLGWRNSIRLASSYGLAISGTMTITSVVYFIVTRHTWRWPLWKATPLLLLFLSFDVPFLLANMLQVLDSAYLVVAVGTIFAVVMVVWSIGRSWLTQCSQSLAQTVEEFVSSLSQTVIARVPGVAVFMASYSQGVPPVLFRMAKRMKLVHETVLLVTVTTEHLPSVQEEVRVEVTTLGHGFHRVIVRYGFLEHYDIPGALAVALDQIGISARAEDLLYLLGHERFRPRTTGNMGPISEAIFEFEMDAQIEQARTDFFITYNNRDEAWARWIAWNLAMEGYQVKIHAWDFGTSSKFSSDMRRAATECDGILGILSPNSLTAPLVVQEWSTLAKNSEANLAKFIPVMVGSCNPDCLHGTVDHINLVDLDRKMARERLLSIVRFGRRRPEAEPDFPGTTALTTSSQSARPTGVSTITAPDYFPGQAVPVFICAAKPDEGYVEELRVHLYQPQKIGELRTWHPMDIPAGAPRKAEMDAHFEEAQIIGGVLFKGRLRRGVPGGSQQA